MGVAIGLALGLGLLLVVLPFLPAAGPPSTSSTPSRPGWRERTRDALVQAGVAGVSPSGLVAACVGVGVVAASLVFVVSLSWSIALVFAVMAGYLPVALVRFRQRRRRTEVRDLWPDVVDNLSSSVRAGMSLPEALGQLGLRGPEALRPAFQGFAEDYRATGRFNLCLDRLKASLADPVADRIVESLRVAREVGGSDLGRLLRTLSSFLREDARTRAELETRQGWTVNAARLAVAAPWLVLAMLATRPDSVRAYDTPLGLAVLGAGGAICLGAYRVMVRIGRLPDEERVLR